MELPSFVDEIVAPQSPFPLVLADGSLTGGIVVLHSDICRRCGNRRCAAADVPLENAADAGIRVGLCSKGVGVAVLEVGSTELIAIGLLITELSGRYTRGLKKLLESNSVSVDQLSRWRDSIDKFLAKFEASARESVEGSLGMLHDVKTTLATIVRNAEEFVEGLPGDTPDEQLATLPDSGVAMIKATEILYRQFLMMPLLTNPAIASTGRRRVTPVYRVVDGLARTLRLLAKERGLTIRMYGASRNAPRTFDSFVGLPFVLLENAIKYARPGSRINVDVNDEGAGVRVEITSESPHLKAEERERIFARGFRGEAAANVSPHGTGLGLHLATIIALAHGASVTHRCNETLSYVDGVPYCQNTFSFTIHGDRGGS